MDKSDEPATEIGAAPERRSVRRRLVQSTLFPLKSPEIVESNGDQKVVDVGCNAGGGGDGGDGDDDDENGEDEELSGSQGKKRKKRQPKTTPQKRNSKKKVKEKNSTPKKKGASNGKVSTNVVENEDASPPPIPNLRLEAKLTAEENSRMFAGRQIHPFFSSWKVEKRSQETTEGESNWCPVERKNKSTTVGPIHVFERVQDEAVSLDWGNWTFCGKAFSNTSHGQEATHLSAFEGSVKSLHFDEISRPLDQCVIQLEDSPETSPAVSAVLVDDPLACCQPLKDSERDCQIDDIAFCSGDAGCLRKSDVEQQSIIHQERIRPYYLGCGNQPEDSLWTVKYQPNKGSEVCGNNESVKFMSEWLHLWHERDIQAIKDSTGGDKCNIKDDDYNCYGSDPDSDDIDEAASLKNILLVTGPVGSGKSAAVYACAKEQGFKVFECNASECRNGALVKLKFGEVLESHCLQRSLENPMDSQSKRIMKSTQALHNGEAMQGCDDEVIELIPISDKVDSCGATETSGKFVVKETRTASNRGALKPLILFEDVDITFPEDRGLIASIQQIAEKAKGPVILTSNSENPVLPDSLDRLEVCFTMPSPKELLCHLCMVSAAEKANIQPHSIEKLIGCCQGDIRKAIMHLQFWCQGRGYRKDRKVQKACDSLLFDLEAGHWVLPKLIPWDFPSQLSELVEKEIAKSLSMMEENSSLMEVVEEELDNKEMQNGLEMHNNDIEAKKEVMLSRNGSVQNCNELAAAFDSECDFSNPSPLGTPVSFPWKKIRRNHAIVMSDSEDESLNNGFPVVIDKDTNNELFLEYDTRSLSHYTNMQNCINQLTDKQLFSEVKKFEDNCCKCLETTDDLQMNSICKSVDVSFVPESLFVPETEIDNGAELLSGIVSCGHVAETVEASVSNEFIENLSPVETDNLDKSMLRVRKNSDMLGNTCNVITDSSIGEEVEDSQNEHAETAMRGYQVMDECSRMDFNGRSNPMEKHSSWVASDSVQESWKKLRGSHTDLKQYVTSEQKDVIRVLKLGLGMSNVISEADLLLSKCQMLDSLELPMAPSEELDAFSRCDEQLQMASTIAQHGFCFYAKEIPAIGLDIGSENRVDLTLEMLASTTNMSAFGKSIGHNDRACRSPNAGKGPETSPLGSEISLKSEMKSSLFDIIKSIAPTRSFLALKGNAFHEYLSSLSCISRSEASRLSEGINKTKKRRVRRARHYLSTGALMLSPEDILLLGQYDFYGKSSSESKDFTFR